MLKALWRFGKRPHFPNKYFGHYPHFTLNVQRCDNIWPILNPVKVAQGGGANIDPRLQCRLGQAKWIPHNRPQTNVFKARGEKMLPELHFQSLTTQLIYLEWHKHLSWSRFAALIQSTSQCKWWAPLIYYWCWLRLYCLHHYCSQNCRHHKVGPARQRWGQARKANRLVIKGSHILSMHSFW